MASAKHSTVDLKKNPVTKIFSKTSFVVRMKKQNLQNERLDDIGLRLLDVARLRNDEVDRIAAAPHLFDAVKARIKAERSSREAPSPWPSFWPGWRTTLVTGSATAVLLIAASIFVFMPGGSPDNFNAPHTFIKPSDIDAPPVVDLPNIKDTVLARHNAHKNISVGNAVSRTRRSRPQREEMSEFYALTYDDDPDDDIRIIRVELPRSSLLAMGINAHAESESEKVKADLVVGSDGVTRAVRFAK